MSNDVESADADETSRWVPPTFLHALASQCAALQTLRATASAPVILANWIVEHLVPIRQALPGFLAHFVCPTRDALALERREEALGDGVVIAVTALARRVLKVQSP